MVNKNFIWITTQFEGFHKYEKAPPEVIFLRTTHRHIFHLKVWIEVFHNDRDIEFIMFKDYIDAVVEECINYDNTGSCEMISDNLHEEIEKDYPKRDIRIEISEDNENGSYKTYEVK